ncbi:MAG: hypothetical protein Q8O15_03600 [Rectinemataceae bacterium]|nr:hypothetical protein [Rectinemataceae bacterium]
MDTPYLIPLLLLGIAGSAQYILGSRKNRWLGKTMSIQAEKVLSPKDAEYVNIGGVLGHNFVYKLRDPWKEAKGSFVFIPRHSLLYMPFSYFLIGNRDRFYINLFTDKKLAGEGHIIEKGYLAHAKIDGIAQMQREEVALAGKTFVFLWRQNELLPVLKRTLKAMPDPTTLAHLCCFADNKTFYLFLKPKKGAIEDNLKKFLELCPEYFR